MQGRESHLAMAKAVVVMLGAEEAGHRWLYGLPYSPLPWETLMWGQVAKQMSRAHDGQGRLDT